LNPYNIHYERIALTYYATVLIKTIKFKIFFKKINKNQIIVKVIKKTKIKKKTKKQKTQKNKNTKTKKQKTKTKNKILFFI
jgi:anaerobic C4-dicarboxylate transporter